MSNDDQKLPRDYIRRYVKKVELVDLTDDNATNTLLKESDKPFKVVLSFDPVKSTLRIHFLELPIADTM